MRESRRQTRARAAKIVRRLAGAYPTAHCALRHESALQLLVATILSAQCTDQRVNVVTRTLFEKYRTAEEFAKARPSTFEKEIRSTGFFRNKTRSILGAARRIVDVFGGEVPGTMEELISLPGVARKTANVILGTWFGKDEGIVVDTHVYRVSHRLRLSREKSPEKVERDLMEFVPRGGWTDFGHRVIWHGRLVCHARKPECAGCPIEKLCPSAGKAR